MRELTPLDLTILTFLSETPRPVRELIAAQPRGSVYRRLKRLGAAVWHDSVWLLPADPKTREDFEWLAEEIEEGGGTALLWEAHDLSADQERAIVARFREDAAERYEVLVETGNEIRRTARRLARHPRPARRQLTALERALRLARRRDFFRAPGRKGAEEAVAAARVALVAEGLTFPATRRIHAVGHASALSR